MNDIDRELTGKERREIRSLVTGMCARYDGHHKVCAMTDAGCHMLTRLNARGGYCKYFVKAVLPLNPILEANLKMQMPEVKECAVCGRKFIPTANHQVYCSDQCEKSGRKKVNAERARKYRENKRVERHALGG